MHTLERLSSSAPSRILVVFLLPLLYLPPGLVLPALFLPFCASVVFLFFWLRTGRFRNWTLLSATAFAAALLIEAGGALRSQSSLPFQVRGQIQGTGTVVKEAPTNSRGNSAFTLEIDRVFAGSLRGLAHLQVRVLGYKGKSPACGQRWVWQGRLDPAAGVLYWKSGRAVGWSAPWWEWRAQVRLGLFSAFDRLDPGAAALSEALLIGAVDDLTPDEKNSFRLAGCSHVLALSGMHLSLLALVLNSLFSRRLSRVTSFLLVQLLLVLFCFLAGPIPSLLRALVMSFLLGFWGLFHKPISLLELLAQSFVVTVVLWPDMAQTLSLQLSFLSLLGLFGWAKLWELHLRPWSGRPLGETLASSASCTVATAPLTGLLFGEVRWAGILMTPPLVLVTTVNLFAAFAFVVLASLFPALPWELANPFFRLLYDTTFSLTRWGAGLPAISSQTALILGLVGGLGFGALFLYNKRHRRDSLPVTLNYDSPRDLQAFLDAKGFNALKRWGQNFLINGGARKKILAALNLKPGEPVWEIGPGLGALTHHLVEEGHPLTVFEIDPGYAAFLRDEFGASEGFVVVEGDVIKTWRSARSSRVSGMKTVGNLPYNAASAIIADFIDGGFFPEVFVVTVQREMADRMSASVGTKNYSSFSVLCQSVFTVEEVLVLRPGSFYPAPEVTSMVVRLVPHSLYPGLDRKIFPLLVRECFSSRRKTLRNNLGSAAVAIGITLDSLTQAFEGRGIDLGRRAETLSVAEFVDVFRVASEKLQLDDDGVKT